MIEVKKNLYTYMTNFDGSFVGFFELMSEILKDLGNDWLEHSTKSEDLLAKEWATVFLDASKTMLGVSGAFAKIRAEYDAREGAKADPVELIQKFKARIEEIKNGNASV